MSIFNLFPDIKYDTFMSHTESSHNRKPVGQVTPNTSVSVFQNYDELWFDCNTVTTRNYSRSVVAVDLQHFLKSLITIDFFKHIHHLIGLFMEEKYSFSVI